jgi:uncharacterized membrane protein
MDVSPGLDLSWLSTLEECMSSERIAALRARVRHPELLRHAEERAASVQNRVADAITQFAGSMLFVYIHIVWFVLWIRYEPFRDVFPYGLLTMVVSLEAIFLSTFVMISQNRADEKRQVLADHQWEMIQLEERQNEQLLRISEKLLALTTEVHALTGEVHQVMKPTRATGIETP